MAAATEQELSDAQSEGVDSPAVLRKVMIEYRDSLMCYWPETIDQTITMSHVIWWLSDLAGLNE